MKASDINTVFKSRFPTVFVPVPLLTTGNSATQMRAAGNAQHVTTRRGNNNITRLSLQVSYYFISLLYYYTTVPGTAMQL
jgi:hypothetical protein